MRWRISVPYTCVCESTHAMFDGSSNSQSIISAMNVVITSIISTSLVSIFFNIISLLLAMGEEPRACYKHVAP